jgi:hypothetical protein
LGIVDGATDQEIGLQATDGDDAIRALNRQLVVASPGEKTLISLKPVRLFETREIFRRPSGSGVINE